MSRLLYIGQLNPGGTCHARYDALKEALPKWEHVTIDTWSLSQAQHRLYRSLAYRFRVGPVVWAENRAIRQRLAKDREPYTISWIDKGVLVTPKTVGDIKARSSTLVHYTPDTAFFANRSCLFNKALNHYDLLVTTKSFEMEHYRRYVPAERVMLVPQGYNPRIHVPKHTPEEKGRHVVFVGLAEPSREQALQALLDAGIPVTLAGVGWERFLKRNRHGTLTYTGKTLWGAEYAAALSHALLGLGLLSQRFPELHTTRTFEIPACGTALLTPTNAETRRFFEPDAAVFYRNSAELVERAQALLKDPDTCHTLAAAGHRIVSEGPYSYPAIMQTILRRIPPWQV